MSLLLNQTVYGRTISSSGEEVSYEYEMTFRSLLKGEPDELSEKAEAQFHSSHLFGLFHSSEVAEEAGYPADLIDGFAGTKSPQVMAVKSFRKGSDPYRWISYRGKGTMLLLKQVLDKWLKGQKAGLVKLPLLMDLPAIYSDDRESYQSTKWEQCTDEHYSTPIDFSYFYAPYRCQPLRETPIASSVEFKIKVVNSDSVRPNLVPLTEIQGDNENGAITTFYFINGFDNPPPPGANPRVIHRDWSWKTFTNVERLLVEQLGFEKMVDKQALRNALAEDFGLLNLLTPVQMENNEHRRYFRTYVKKTKDQIFVARNALLNTQNVEPLVSFPKFWKEAWENGDVIYFGGHADGVSPSLSTVLKTVKQIKLGELAFNPRKTQIALFDACSSYAHYHDLYAGLLPKSLHLMTHGLVSLFHLAPTTVEELLRITLGDRNQQLSWEDALRQIESRQLIPHIQYTMQEFSTGSQNRAIRKYERKGLSPTSLINVRVP